MRYSLAIAAVLAAGALGVSAVSAETLGAREYARSCAICHGERGEGNGPLAMILTVNVPDLTTLSARNGGVFPYDEVISVVDGQRQMRAHGSPMPVWGRRFTEAEIARYGPTAGTIIARGRILSVAHYLETLQREE